MPKDKISKEIEAKFGNQLRVRVNGVLIEENKILMIRHKMGDGKVFWSVPGGGMVYGSSATENLKREFWEETGLHVRVDEYLFVHEFLCPPLHAMEHFFFHKKDRRYCCFGKRPRAFEKKTGPGPYPLDDARRNSSLAQGVHTSYISEN